MIVATRPDPSPATLDRRRDWQLLALLLLLVLPIRVWLLYDAEAAARDSIGYIRYALLFEWLPWTEVLTTQQQHPGYSAAVLAVSVPVRRAWGGTTPDAMQFAAQLTSVLSALLLLYPTYHLGRFFFGRPVGFWGALLFQYLPTSGQHLSDGISEAFYLLLVVSALWQAVQAVQGQSVRPFVLCGLFTGLAYLTRPEGLFVAFVTAAVTLAMQFHGGWRLRWRDFARNGACLACTLAAVGSVYVGATGKLTGKPSNGYIIQKVFEVITSPFSEQADGRLPGNGPLFAVTFQPSERVPARLGQSARAVVMEVNHTLYYGGAVAALLGLICAAGRLRHLPGAWLLTAYSLMHSLLLMTVAMSVHYVSDRHVMVLTLFAAYFVVAGLGVLASTALRLAWRGTSATTTGARSPAFWSAVLVVAFIAVCLPKTAQRLHGNRAGNRAAGQWLAQELREGDVILDDHAWSLFYSGLLFKEGKDRPLPPHARPRAFVVMTRSRDHEVDRARKAEEQRVREGEGRLVYHWPEHADVSSARVVVYEQPRDPKTHPWATAAR